MRTCNIYTGDLRGDLDAIVDQGCHSLDEPSIKCKMSVVRFLRSKILHYLNLNVQSGYVSADYPTSDSLFRTLSSTCTSRPGSRIA